MPAVLLDKTIMILYFSFMKIQNFNAINDKTKESRFFDFEKIISGCAQQYSDMGLCDRFQVISDSPRKACWRYNVQLMADDSYLGTWWLIDLDAGTIVEGNDCSTQNGYHSYKDKHINCNEILASYQIT